MLVILQEESQTHWQLLISNIFSMILDTDSFSSCTESPEMCPLITLAPWVSSKPSPSVPETPGGQSIKEQFHIQAAPPISCAGSSLSWPIPQFLCMYGIRSITNMHKHYRLWILFFYTLWGTHRFTLCSIQMYLLCFLFGTHSDFLLCMHIRGANTFIRPIPHQEPLLRK